MEIMLKEMVQDYFCKAIQFLHIHQIVCFKIIKLIIIQAKQYMRRITLSIQTLPTAFFRTILTQ